MANVSEIRAPQASALLEALAAARPALDELGRLYGWLIGDWNVALTDHLPDGTRCLGSGEWHFGWVLGGWAMQDVWISPRRGERPPAGEAPGPRNRYGTTIRLFDPAIDAWHVTWINPAQNYVAHLTGRARGRDIVQEGTGPNGERLRWTFSDITTNRFRWVGEVSLDSGRSWRMTQEMSALRAPASAEAPLGAASNLMDALLAAPPSGAEPDGPGLFAPLVGSWEGTLAVRNPDGAWTMSAGALHFDWVLESRAIEDIWIFPDRTTTPRSTPPDGPDAYVRCFNPGTRTWSIIRVSPANHAISMHQARADGDEIFVEGTTPEGHLQRWIFSDITGDAFRWRNILSRDHGRTWQVMDRVSARRMGGLAL